MSSVRSFHRLFGRDVTVTPDGCGVTVTPDGCGVTVTSSSRGAGRCCYAFTAQALDGGDVICAQVLGVDDDVISRGGLAFGMTSCDPDTVTPSELPDDPEMLIDRNEYWVVIRDVLRGCACRCGDILAFTRAESGEVRLHRNGEYVTTLMHIDRTLPMWAFFDLCAGITKLQLLASTRELQQKNSFTASSPVNNKIMENPSTPIPIEYIRELTEKHKNMTKQVGKESSRPSHCALTSSLDGGNVQLQTQQLSLAEKKSSAEFIKEADDEMTIAAKSALKVTMFSAASPPTPPVTSVATLSQRRPTMFKFRSSVSFQDDANWQSEFGVLSPSAVRAKNRWPPPSHSGVSSSSEQLNVSDNKNNHSPASATDAVPLSCNLSGVTPSRNSNRYGVILRRESDSEPWTVSRTGAKKTPAQQSAGIEQTTSNEDRLKIESTTKKPEIASNECCSCWEKPKDCVLYRCGHLCLCYDCATKIKQRQQPPLCPICRQTIDDIVRIYNT